MNGVARLLLARVVLATALTLAALPAGAAEAPTAVGGILDLREWSFDNDGPVALAGEIEFFWGRHLTSRAVPLATADGGLDYTQVPASWNEHVHLGETVGSYGIATYRVNVLVSDRSPLGLKFPELGTAYRLLIDGEAVLEVGQPGPVKEKTIPRYAPTFLQFTPKQQRVELLLQVSNFHHRLGGSGCRSSSVTRRSYRRCVKRRSRSTSRCSAASSYLGSTISCCSPYAERTGRVCTSASSAF